jgi:beta-glucuronidase
LVLFTSATWADSRQSLDGVWNYIVDPYESGFYDYRAKENPNGIFKDKDWTKTKDLVEYDFSHSDTLKVPGDWNTQRETLKYYEGNLWYRRLFEAKPQAGKRYFLRFDAINYTSFVYLNGTKLGSHEGGFTPFEFEVTDNLKPGTNSVVVKVDNRRKVEGVPTLFTDWWNYGGITRSVWLVERPQAFVRDWNLSLNKEGHVQAWVRMQDAKGGEKVELEIPELKSHTEAVVDKEGFVRLNLEVSPRRWSPESPKLYDVILTAGEDRLTDQVGFRTLEAKGSKILLNGKPVFLRGISLHDEAPGPLGGRITTVEQARQLLTWAKALGCNYVRLAHYPHPEFMVREADKMGIMVWSEIPVYWTIQWKNPATKELALSQLSDMIRRDRNRAAIVIWSIGNETPYSEEREAFMTALADRAHEMDPTRLVSAALEQSGDDQKRVDDPLGEHLDVLGLNEYVGWYGGLPEDCRKLTWTAKWDKPLVVSEFGADAKQGRHSATKERWSEEYQAYVYEEQLAMLSRIPSLAGMSPWILKDFRSPRRWLPGVQDGWNRKGLVSEIGEHKAAFEVLRKYYEDLAKKN